MKKILLSIAVCALYLQYLKTTIKDEFEKDARITTLLAQVKEAQKNPHATKSFDELIDKSTQKIASIEAQLRQAQQENNNNNDQQKIVELERELCKKIDDLETLMADKAYYSSRTDPR